MIERFNLRVYALWIRENKILITNETINRFSFTKFPGGGVEKGEGIRDALVREMREETGINIIESQLQHFYTTDFFQQSAFNPKEQIVSIYYRLLHDEDLVFTFKNESTATQHRELKLEWQLLSQFKKSQLTFPIDQIVFDKMQESGLVF
jgi:ADP-ribose pyrophosphatase YjhB (NUDIX family)